MPETDEWATLDALLGVEVVDLCSSVLGGVAFYGRCSTEDNQDPQTSRGWQLGNASKFVEPFGGCIVAEYFDIGQSRSVPWDRRVEGSQLLQVLKNPDRGFGAVVVGEGTRCGQVRRPQPFPQDAHVGSGRNERVRRTTRPGTCASSHGCPGGQRGTASGRPGTVRLRRGRRWSSPQSAKVGGGVSAQGAGAR